MRSTANFDAERLPDFQAARTVDGVFDLLFRYYAAQLKRGPDGHRELLRALGKFQEDELLQERVRMDQEAWGRCSYRWMRFLVRHEKEAVALLETLLEEAAANRTWFRALSPETFSTISDYWGYVPGMVDDKKLARLRLLLERVLALDPAPRSSGILERAQSASASSTSNPSRRWGSHCCFGGAEVFGPRDCGPR